MAIIAIATSSNDKIKGFKKAFAEFYHTDETNLTIISQKTTSDVPDQPFNSDTYNGAQNRINNLLHSSNAEENYDFIVSCEAGIEGFMDLFFNVQVVCVFDVKAQKYYWGKSAGWQIPTEDIKEIKEKGLDLYMRDKGLTCLQDLLGPENSRANDVYTGTHLALSTMKNL